MQTIGLIGGMSWESTAAYYEGLNKGVQERLGGLHSAKIVLASVDLAELTALQEKEAWDQVAEILVASAKSVVAGGADLILMCTTTFHKVYDEVAAAVDVPVLHLADVLAAKAKELGITKAGFLASRYTLENDFFAQRISDHGVDVNMPDTLHVELLDSIIYEELVHRNVVPGSRKRVLEVVHELWDGGSDGVILGASELSLLVRPSDVDVPILDAITVHVEAALNHALPE